MRPAPDREGSDARAPDEWASIRELTPARVGLGRAGGSVPTRRIWRSAPIMRKRATPSIAPSTVPRIAAQLTEAGHRSVAVSSAAASRAEYIRRPDLGRTLTPDDAATLRSVADGPCDLALVLCDGLSPRAIEQHAAALAAAIASSPLLSAWSFGPITVVTNGRVAIGDEIGAALRARIVAVLIGERPGLSVPESIGVYLTFDPAPGRSDAQRNCISNIHDHGLTVEAAAGAVASLATRARLAGGSGVTLGLDLPPALG